MSDSRRSGRSKKSIDYTSFGGDDSDGDFADPTPPPPKRSKKDNPKAAKKLEKKPRERNRKDSASKMTKRKERVPLDDKLFDRDLELAMELSRQDSQSSSQESEADQVQYMGNRQREISVMVHSAGPDPEEKTGNQPVPEPLRSETRMSHNEDGNKENMADKAVHTTSKTKKIPPIITNSKEEAITLIETLEGSDVERGGRRQRKAASAAVAKQREMMSDEDNGTGDNDVEFKAGPDPEEKTGNQPVPEPLRSETHMSHNEDGNKENMADKAVHTTSKTKKIPPIITNSKEEAITLIETLEGSDVERGGRRQRKAASAAVAKQREMMSDEDNGTGDNDVEFKADVPENNFDASSSDDDYDAGDGDSDFEGLKATTKKKKKGKSPKASSAEKKTPKPKGGKKAVASSKAKHPGRNNCSGPKASVPSPVTPVARRPQPKGTIRGFTPPTISNGSGNKKSQQVSLSCSQSAVKRPGWCSPTSSGANNPLGGVKLVSPSQPLRLGLSRYARVKPLHSNAKVP